MRVIICPTCVYSKVNCYQLLLQLKIHVNCFCTVGSTQCLPGETPVILN